MIPFRSSAVTGFHETETLVEDITLIVTACGGPPGSKGNTKK